MTIQKLSLGAAANDGTGNTLRAGGDIINAGLHELYAVRNSLRPLDHLIIAGASIMESAFNSQTVAEGYYNTLTGKTINLIDAATSGYDIADLDAAMAGIISANSGLTGRVGCLVHCLGNNVSPTYNAGKRWSTLTTAEQDTIRNHLTSVLDQIVAAGWVPILADITFRNYGGTTIDNEDAGSREWNELLVKPVAAQYCPEWTLADGTPVTQFYQLIRNSYDTALSADNIHMTAHGNELLRRQIAWVLAQVNAWGRFPAKADASTPEPAQPGATSSTPEALTVVMDDLTTANTTPTLTGSVSDPTAGVVVDIAGASYTATVDANGDWTAVVTTALALQAHTATATATLGAETATDTATITVQEEVSPGAFSGLLVNFDHTTATAKPATFNTIKTGDSNPGVSAPVTYPSSWIQLDGTTSPVSLEVSPTGYSATSTAGRGNAGNDTLTVDNDLCHQGLAFLGLVSGEGIEGPSYLEFVGVVPGAQYEVKVSARRSSTSSVCIGEYNVDGSAWQEIDSKATTGNTITFNVTATSDRVRINWRVKEGSNYAHIGAVSITPVV